MLSKVDTMIERVKWIERKFSFDFEAGMFPAVVGRMMGTPARLEDLIKSVPADILTKKLGDSWTIQEQVGHLLDLEPLHIGRLDDFMAGVDRLRPADMSNKRTHEANHNKTPINDLLSDFRSIRMSFVNSLNQLHDDDVLKTSLHPRLNKSMRLVDMLYFTVEHDDHHISTMIELKQKLTT